MIFGVKPTRMREHPAVNRRVVGSNPTGGAIFVDRNNYLGLKKAENERFRLFLCRFERFSAILKLKIKYKIRLIFTTVFLRFSLKTRLELTTSLDS